MKLYAIYNKTQDYFYEVKPLVIQYSNQIDFFLNGTSTDIPWVTTNKEYAEYVIGKRSAYSDKTIIRVDRNISHPVPDGPDEDLENGDQLEIVTFNDEISK